MNLGANWIEQNFVTFEKNLNGGSKYPLHEKRKLALSSFQKLGFPTSSQEEWKYTNPQLIKDTFFSLVTKPGKVENIEEFLTKDLESYKVVFIDGIFNELLSANKFEEGLAVSNIEKAQKTGASFAGLVNDTLGSIASLNDTFVSINTSFINDGVIIHVSKSALISKPIEILFLSTKEAKNSVVNPRILVVLEENAQVKITEKYSSTDESINYLTNSVFECQAAKNAHVDHYRIQQDSLGAFHISTIQANLEDNATFRTHTFSFGSKLARNNVNIIMNGSSCNATMNGLSVLSGSQHVDNTTLLDHTKPHCESHELYKGIYNDQSKGVFSGTIIVREDAQKTNAIQSNRSLLLSDQAEVNTKPQLKIWADDVKCTHGATIGQMDEEALFYIQSRGVSKEDAKKLLVHAFAGEVLSEIKIPEITEVVRQALINKLDR